jgi:hypothetical protein
LKTIILKPCKSRNKNRQARTAATAVVASLGSEGENQGCYYDWVLFYWGNINFLSDMMKIIEWSEFQIGYFK